MDQEADKVYLFRPFVAGDLNFVANSWGSSYYKGALYQRHLSPEEFHKHHRPIRDKFFANPNGAIIICASRSDENIIIGWAAVEKPEAAGLILHYVYVKQAFKGWGIANELIERALPERPILYTHLTERADKIMYSNGDGRFKDFYYSPHLT